MSNKPVRQLIPDDIQYCIPVPRMLLDVDFPEPALFLFQKLASYCIEGKDFSMSIDNLAKLACCDKAEAKQAMSRLYTLGIAHQNETTQTFELTQAWREWVLNNKT